MSKLSVSEAAKQFQVSRPTLQKALKDGVISGNRSIHNGVETWQIDVSELARIYSLRGGKSSPKLYSSDNGLTGKPEKENSNLSNSLQDELEAVRHKLAEAEKQAAVATARAEERQAQIEDMRKDLEAARQEKSALLAALPKPQVFTNENETLIISHQDTENIGFFSNLFKRKPKLRAEQK